MTALMFAGFFLMLFTGCFTGKKLDRFVAKQYGNRVPPVSAKTPANISISSTVSSGWSAVSSSGTRTTDFLPLLFYWQWDYQNSCNLNPAIAVNEFTNALDRLARRRLEDQLGIRHLEVTIRQFPHGFVIHDKNHMIWFIYGFAWEKVTLVPQPEDFVVSYKLTDGNQVVKEGEFDLHNSETAHRFGFFESWRKATSTFLAGYNHDVNDIARQFVDKMEKEL